MRGRQRLRNGSEIGATVLLTRRRYARGQIALEIDDRRRRDCAFRACREVPKDSAKSRICALTSVGMEVRARGRPALETGREVRRLKQPRTIPKRRVWLTNPSNPSTSTVRVKYTGVRCKFLRRARFPRSEGRSSLPSARSCPGCSRSCKTNRTGRTHGPDHPTSAGEDPTATRRRRSGFIGSGLEITLPLPDKSGAQSERTRDRSLGGGSRSRSRWSRWTKPTGRARSGFRTGPDRCPGWRVAPGHLPRV